MTAKEFFKSTAFRSLAVLLCIVIASGALIAVASGLLYVSPAEKRNRIFAQIYGGKVTEERALVDPETDDPLVYSGGTVNQAFYMSDGSYIVQATGTGGYSNGSITVWVIFAVTGSEAAGDLALAGVEKVVYESNDKQSFIGRFTEADYAQFTEHDEEVAEGKLFGSGIDVIKTGASAPLTLNALTNAVNVALEYFRVNVVKETPAPEAYRFEEYLDMEKTRARVEGERVYYSLATLPNRPAGAFEISVTVHAGVIEAYSIETNGSTADRYVAGMPESVKDGTLFLGKDAEAVCALLNENGGLAEGVYTPPTIQTAASASRSTESCVRAAAFAAANYQAIAAQGGLNA